MRIGSLFSGIGGLELGLERAGVGHTVWQVELDPFARRVLAKHWPHVVRYEDVREVHGCDGTGCGNCLAPVEVVCAGVPCQPISQAAARVDRSDGEWMWPEARRVIGELAPRYVVIEQPEAIRYARRGLQIILGDLAALGFDAEWFTLRASDVGAPHHRARLWVVAYAHGDRQSALPVDDEMAGVPEPRGAVSDWRTVPDLRVADGIRDRVLRRGRLGNAVVPQVAEVVGHVLLDIHRGRVGA